MTEKTGVMIVASAALLRAAEMAQAGLNSRLS